MNYAGTAVGIDATNIRDGGGITHLAELLRAADPTKAGIDRVVVWAPQATLDAISDRSWISKIANPIFEASIWKRTKWLRQSLHVELERTACSILFCPGGTISSSFRPAVTMSQNLLPFELKETFRYGLRLATAKQLVLRYVQSSSFRNATGVIFLTVYARNAVERVAGTLKCRTAIVPHGIDASFVRAPRIGKSTTLERERSASSKIRIVYVSKVEPYKHHIPVVKAVAKLRSSGLPAEIEFVGPGYEPWLGLLRREVASLDPGGTYINLLGAVPYQELPGAYERADICVFASSCENMPNILIESMAAGLPIACSRMGPMPEILGPEGQYFDPEDSESIAAAIRVLIEDPEARERSANSAYERAKEYSWERCASETFEFLSSFVG